MVFQQPIEQVLFDTQFHHPVFPLILLKQGLIAQSSLLLYTTILFPSFPIYLGHLLLQTLLLYKFHLELAFIIFDIGMLIATELNSLFMI